MQGERLITRQVDCCLAEMCVDFAYANQRRIGQRGIVVCVELRNEAVQGVFTWNVLDQRSDIIQLSLLRDVNWRSIRRARSARVGQIAVSECKGREDFVGRWSWQRVRTWYNISIERRGEGTVKVPDSWVRSGRSIRQ